MSNKTKIEWCDRTWNVVTGCTKVSPGCAHCYAERMAKRLAGRYGYPEKPNSFRVTLHPEKLEEMLHWKGYGRVFVDSMSDLFHEDVPFEFIDEVFSTMWWRGGITFLVLTKRVARMVEYFKHWNTPMKNVWLGVSVEDQKTADQRIPFLLRTPAAKRFVSIEPMLGEIDLNRAIFGHARDKGNPWPPNFSWVKGNGLDWAICGGESGTGARPMHPDWARGIRDQCQAAGVPFFFKQWGAWWPCHPQYGDTDPVERFEDEHPNADQASIEEICLENNGGWAQHWSGNDSVISGYQPRPSLNPWWMHRVGKGKAGRLLDGREWNEFPEVEGEW
jgi:protein gp37